MSREVRYQLIVPEEFGGWPLDRLQEREWELPSDGGIYVQVIAYFDETGHHEFMRRRVLLFEVGPDEVAHVGPFARLVRAGPRSSVCFRLVDISPHQRLVVSYE